MQKNNENANQRIKILVESFISQELLLFNKSSLGYVKKHFRYLHLGNRLIRKINSTRNGIFKLVSKEGDAEIIIKKGNSNIITFITIEKSELCFKSN